MWKEFKAFAMRGSVIDLAIGVIIGAAFAKIISSFIDAVITPLLLKPALDAAHLNTLEELTVFGAVKYGVFLSAVINFLLIAAILFAIVKAINSAQKKQAADAPPPPSAEVVLLTEIRDILKTK